MEKQIIKLESQPKLAKKKRVAAYARVSTGTDAMLHSLAQQVSYYSDLIKENPMWTYAGLYADEACTGTKAARPEFQRLLSDCEKGLIDIVLTKSISRFARNTVVLLETVRRLKALGIDVYFEEQRIHTLSSDGELMLTILASYAQEESKSVSDNVKWRIRKGFSEGELLCVSKMFGYRFGKKIEIVPEQAEMVRGVFARAIRGDSLCSIARWLNQNPPAGPFNRKWKASHIRDLLSNEKYTGNALLQKRYVNNHYDKKTLRNNGELPKYYATETHPAIIDQETFDAAQAVLARISASRPTARAPQHYAFSGFILCPLCKKHYKRIVRHGLPGWICPTYMSGGKASCQSRRIPEDTLIGICRSLLGLESFEENTMRKTVKFITAVNPNTLVFHMIDGTEKKAEWKYESRSKSWTPEMKAKAAEFAKRRYHG